MSKQTKQSAYTCDAERSEGRTLEKYGQSRSTPTPHVLGGKSFYTRVFVCALVLQTWPTLCCKLAQRLQKTVNTATKRIQSGAHFPALMPVEDSCRYSVMPPVGLGDHSIVEGCSSDKLLAHIRYLSAYPLMLHVSAVTTYLIED